MKQIMRQKSPATGSRGPGILPVEGLPGWQERQSALQQGRNPYLTPPRIPQHLPVSDLPQGRTPAAGRRSQLTGPILLIGFGVLFLIDRFTAFGFHQTWPVLLIVMGILKLTGII
jgi:Domain of unknown function (DUF5668)